MEFNMGDVYAECHKSHSHLGGKTDGCQEYLESWTPSKCDVCGCHRNFHRKVVKYKTEVVYTKCQKIHDLKIPNSVDGCQEFIPAGKDATLNCAACGCHKGFHRNEVVIEVTPAD